MSSEIVVIPQGGIASVRGFLAGAVCAGIKEGVDKLDLGILCSQQACEAAGVFTSNLVKAAPILLCQKHLANGRALTKAGVHALYEDFYKDEPFVRVTAEPPQTKHTWCNNLCLIYPMVDRRAGRLVVVSCIDNLVKGAAGQAIQNMNLMLGFPEAAGLDLPAVYP